MRKRIILVMIVSVLPLLLVYFPIVAMGQPVLLKHSASLTRRTPLFRAPVWAQTTPPTVTATTRVTMTNTALPELQIPCTVNALRLNLRSGPGPQYNVIGSMAKGTPFTATERLADSSWLAGNSPQQNGWTAALFVTCTTAVTQLRLSTSFTQTAPLPVAATPSTVTTTTSSTAAPAVVQPISTGAFKLLQPLTARLHGRQTFQWQPRMTLQPNQAFEVVFWQPGQDPLPQSFGLVQSKTEAGITIDLDKLSTILPQLQWGKEYQWGILLVQARPYRRLQYIGGGHQFLFAVDPSDPTDQNKDGKPDELPAPPKAPPK